MKINAADMGLAVAIAWPETYCKQPGSWYDRLMDRTGVSKNNYYRAGHAALVLVKDGNSGFQYFDFGRYHAPFNHGRVRSAETDHDLRINIKPRISGDSTAILNIDELLEELQLNKACHGNGIIYASTMVINYRAALKEVKKMQDMGPVPYGPFIRSGSNCSRFVFRGLIAGKPALKTRLRLKYLVPFTPTPMSNVRSKRRIHQMEQLIWQKPAIPSFKPGKSFLESTLPAPPKHINIPATARWLSGEGAGSWFVVKQRDNALRVTRYSQEGDIECSGKFSGPDIFMLNGYPPEITHFSNCREITIMADGKYYVFKNTDQ
ncbi:MAG: hypothetical protein K9J25_06110 [Bacteroidales bacterium]|nr:hypothetical protein [Bacteroidales bacterium]